ncbi:small-conductance mechanosensitive channel [Oikeobacillus pervagus]|uniref:Small-conductance mechanosensitive channel n=1 Tax=Oikeobacillus pervagus TaxID=1325931 RepID=A0AAJ1SW39_9BACI|nr:DUF2768 domain-containing protein [Oikeobacillus pervagus]MDQ0213704.1 small-conductance mechanosensitive channel [Oikeobacillus pervagus]
MMSSMMKMWISFISMGLMFAAIFTIYLSRYKLKQGILKFVTALIAYICMIVGGLMMIYIVFSGPTA